MYSKQHDPSEFLGWHSRSYACPPRILWLNPSSLRSLTHTLFAPLRLFVRSILQSTKEILFCLSVCASGLGCCLSVFLGKGDQDLRNSAHHIYGTPAFLSGYCHEPTSKRCGALFWKHPDQLSGRNRRGLLLQSKASMNRFCLLWTRTVFLMEFYVQPLRSLVNRIPSVVQPISPKITL